MAAANMTAESTIDKECLIADNVVVVKKVFITSFSVNKVVFQVIVSTHTACWLFYTWPCII